MRKKQFFTLLCLLTVIILSACRSPQTDPDGQIAEVPTDTPTPANTSILTDPPIPTPVLTDTPTPTLVPTDTATLTPVPTDTPTLTPVPTTTPVAGIGIPTGGGRWQVTVKGVRQETKLTTGSFLDKTTHTPKQAGYVFLVVDFRFKSLDPVPQAGVPSQAITIIGSDGQILTAVGIGGLLGDNYVCVEECSYVLKPADHHLAFLVKEKDIDQSWNLQFPDVSPIPFSLSGQTEHAFVTEISNESGVLPPVCRVEGSSSLSSIESLSYKYWTDTGLTLASMALDGSAATEVCAGVAFTDFQRTADGAVVLLVGPQQGWSDLYMIESDGRVFVLVKNGPAIDAEFDPTGRYLLFTTTKLGEKDREDLYVFDRETALLRLVKDGKWVNFRFLTNGRSLVTVKPSSDGDTQFFLSRADMINLDRLDLPDGVDAYEIASDGEHIVYSDIDNNSNDQLFIAELDGRNTKKLAATEDYLSGKLSPDGQVVLINFMNLPKETKEFRYKVELYNLTTKDRWIIIQNGLDVDTDFSADSRWALVYNTVESEGAEEDEKTLYLVSTADGRIVHEIENVIKAVFSPDNTQLAYTMHQADGNPAMYILTLENGATQSLGLGVVSGWLPAARMASDTLIPALDVEEPKDTGSDNRAGDTITLLKTPTQTPQPTPTSMATSTPMATITPTLPPLPTATVTPSQQWMPVADSTADFANPTQSWSYHWSKGRNNFNWQEMQKMPNDCFQSPNDMTLEICRDTLTVEAHSRGDAALQWKAPQSGTYRFEWSADEVNGKSSIWFYSHLNRVRDLTSGVELPYSVTVENVDQYHQFFFLPQYNTPYRIKIYQLQE